MRKRDPEVPLTKRPKPSHVPNMNGLIEAEVDTDLLDGLLRHGGAHEPQRGVARGEVHHEEDDRGDAKDEGNGAEELPHNECSHGPLFTPQPSWVRSWRSSSLVGRNPPILDVQPFAAGVHLRVAEPLAHTVEPVGEKEKCKGLLVYQKFLVLLP